MLEFLAKFLQAATALFIITDPIGNIPILMGLTSSETQKQRRSNLLLAITVGFALLLCFTFGGTFILSLFHISLSAFKIGGGIILLSIALMIIIRGKASFEEEEDVGIVPLGCPLIVGPGAITTGMMLMELYGWKVTLSAVVVNFFLNYGILYYGEKIMELLGATGAKVLSKIMTIIIASIAVQLIVDGIFTLAK